MELLEEESAMCARIGGEGRFGPKDVQARVIGRKGYRMGYRKEELSEERVIGRNGYRKGWDEPLPRPRMDCG